jgi:hypothetical protein
MKLTLALSCVFFLSSNFFANPNYYYTDEESVSISDIQDMMIGTYKRADEKFANNWGGMSDIATEIDYIKKDYVLRLMY